MGATAVATPTTTATPALGSGGGQWRHPWIARRDGGGGAAIHPSRVVAAGDGRAERSHELVEFQLRGLSGATSYPEYPSLMETTIDSASATAVGVPCGSTTHENRFGTPMALMLLPNYTNGCVDSMEGLLFESATSTPYHFINQAELSVAPSEAMVGRPVRPGQRALGVQHLQLLGVKYFMAASPPIEQEADADPAPDAGGDHAVRGARQLRGPPDTTWKIYLIHNSSLVTPLTEDPDVLTGVKPAPTDGSARHQAIVSGTRTRASWTSSWPRADRRRGPACRGATSAQPSSASRGEVTAIR